MQITDDDVKIALAAYKACDDFEHECMRAALEAALMVREQKCDNGLLKHLRATAELTAQGMKNSKPEDYLEGQAAACIEDLAAALRKLRNEVAGSMALFEPLAVQEMGVTNYNVMVLRADEALATLERWGLK